MTTANKITIGRILLVPFFVVNVLYYVDSGREIYRFLAVLAFALAALSDSLDGYIARRYQQHSDLGKILDPLADKLLLVSGILLLSFKNEPYFERLPIWLAATVISRDVLLVLGAVIVQHACGKVRVQPVLIGKLATVLQMVCVLWILLQFSSRWLGFWAVGAAVCTGLSGLIYVFEGVRQLSASPSSSAVSRESR